MKGMFTIMLLILAVSLNCVVSAHGRAKYPFDYMLDGGGWSDFAHFASKGYCTASRRFSYGSIAVTIKSDGLRTRGALRHVSGDISDVFSIETEKHSDGIHGFSLSAVVSYNVWIDGNFQKKEAGMNCQAIITGWV